MRDSRRPYPSDLSDAGWAILAPLLPPPAARGRPRKWPPRLVADAVFYLLRTGCAWRILPREPRACGRGEPEGDDGACVYDVRRARPAGEPETEDGSANGRA